MNADGSLVLAVLGDSIAFGQGARVPADAVGARLAATLSADGTPTRATVVAVPGAQSSALAGQVQRALAARPDVALVVIGANDLTHLVPAARAADQLGRAVTSLRAADVQVVVVPAPDLGSVPFVPVQLRGFAKQASAALREAQTRAALRAGARVALVDVVTERFAADAALFSADRFHPSSKGYELIARAVLPAMSAAVAEVLAAR